MKAAVNSYVSLRDALEGFLKERNCELSRNPLDSLAVPLQGGRQISIPVAFLFNPPGQSDSAAAGEVAR